MTQDAIEIRAIAPDLLAVSLGSAEATPLFTALRSARSELADTGAPVPAVSLDMRCPCSPSMLRTIIRAVERAGFTYRGLTSEVEAASAAAPVAPPAAPTPVSVPASATPSQEPTMTAARRRRARFDDAPTVPAVVPVVPVPPVAAEAPVVAVVSVAPGAPAPVEPVVVAAPAVEASAPIVLAKEEPVAAVPVIAEASVEVPLAVEAVVPVQASPVVAVEPPVATPAAASDESLLLAPANPALVVTPSIGAQMFTGNLKKNQSFHAPMRDLIVSGAVAKSAEISADGSVHVYGEMRGRVMAGAAGDRRARIYCLEFYAELVIIAGYFNDFKDVRAQIEGKSVEIWLEGGELRVRSLGEIDD